MSFQLSSPIVILPVELTELVIVWLVSRPLAASGVTTIDPAVLQSNAKFVVSSGHEPVG